MSARYKSDWIRTIDEFYERENFPSCLGPLNVNDIKMRKPSESGSQSLDHCFISVEIVGSVGIATDYGLDGPRLNPVGDEIFPPVQTGPGVHPASCKTGTGSFPG